jgi:hypothetical protein
MSDEEPPHSAGDGTAPSPADQCEVLFDIQRQHDHYRFRCELYDRAARGAEVRFFEGESQLFTRTYFDCLVKGHQLIGRKLAILTARTMQLVMEKGSTAGIERSLLEWRE